MKTVNYLTILVFTFGMVVSLPRTVNAADSMGTAFTYQGRLIDDDKPADGLYDFSFQLHDDEVPGGQIGVTLPKAGVEVIDGYFTVDLDFGEKAFNGDERWLRIFIKKGVSYLALKPLQPINPTPYAIHATNATRYVGQGSSGDYLHKIGSNWIAKKPAIVQQSQNNMQPYLAVNFVIALQGLYPSRNGGEPFLGEIMMVGFTFAPRGWAFCNGQILSISQNTALFSLLGTTYGGDGRTTFALPDLRGRVPVNSGGNSAGPGLNPRILGQRSGTETITGTTIN